MLDPIAALGLAANIVQFVDFSWKLINDAKDLYESNNGASADNDVLQSVTNDIMLLDNKLTAPTAPGAIPDSIRTLASQCKDVARELLRVLDKLKVDGPHKKWKSFVQALRSVWKKKQIQSLVERLERLRSEMQFRLQLSVMLVDCSYASRFYR